MKIILRNIKTSEMSALFAVIKMKVLYEICFLFDIIKAVLCVHCASLRRLFPEMKLYAYAFSYTCGAGAI